jgi:hypothetical protein
LLPRDRRGDPDAFLAGRHGTPPVLYAAFCSIPMQLSINSRRPNVRAVFGISNPYEWAFDITTTFDLKQISGAQCVFLRSFPEAA